MKHVLTGFILVFSFLLNAGNVDVFEKANKLYTSGKYQEAISNYESTLNEGVHSFELYYNLGCAYYKLNEVAPAIYYYEKAKQINPLDKDLKVNLALAKNMVLDAIEPLPKTFFQKLRISVFSMLTINQFSYLVLILIWLSVFAFSVYYFSKTSKYKRIFFIFSITLTILFSATLCINRSAFRFNLSQKYAVVFVEEIRVLGEPVNNSEELFRLHEGTKVKVLDNLNSWFKIKLEDGQDGWVQGQSLKVI